MKDPHLATVWTARLCAGLWLASLAVAVRSGRAETARRRWRGLWTAGAVALLIHVLAAFHFEHSWSHEAAYEHTREQTAATVGVNWGGGLYFNYIAVVVWLADAAFLWRVTPLSRRQNSGLAVDWFVAFMMVNATVVFGPWGWRPAGVAIVLWLLFLFRKRRTGSENASVEVS